MSIMENIRRRQALALRRSALAPPSHRPEMLYIGCPDARLDPVSDIGIEQGNALIFRNIGALVLRENPSMGAVLEYFLHHLPPGQNGVKHIVVAGHTDCGGLKACQHGCRDEHDHYLPQYLESLNPVRARVMAEAKAQKWNDEQILHALEKESVRHSLGNLMDYSVVEQAVKSGWLELHGWVIDTATKSISEMNPKTREFEPMSG
jgi:carbonic anhydrase